MTFYTFNMFKQNYNGISINLMFKSEYFQFV